MPKGNFSENAENEIKAERRTQNCWNEQKGTYMPVFLSSEHLTDTRFAKKKNQNTPKP